MTMTFKLVVGRVPWEHKPTRENGEIVECQRRQHYVVREASAEMFYKWVSEGRCWRAGTLKEGAKDFKKTSFIGSQIIALDFDNSDKQPEAIVDYAKSLGIEPNFYYYSFSQGKKEGYNFRVVWILDKVIEVKEYEALYAAIQRDKVFASADKATKDISRLWFGTRNGGELLRVEPIELDRFSVFAYEVKNIDKAQKTEIKDIVGLEVVEEDDYVLPLIDTNNTKEQIYLPWYELLRGKCDLWDKWVNGEYLHYSQRLLLFTELKKLKYPANIQNGKHSIFQDVMCYYDAQLYSDSKCDEREIRYFLTNRTSKANNPIVCGKWTIAEFFRSGAYSTFKQEKKRISREQLQQEADKAVYETLNRAGIDYVDCQCEVGKTERILNYLRDVDLTQKKVIYAVPRYNLLDEFIKRAEGKGISRDIMCYPRKIDYTAEDLYYLNAGFPQGIAITEQMLERKRELQRLRDKKDKGLFLITHACLSHMEGIEADEIIIDENIEDCLIYKVNIYLTALTNMRQYLRDEGGKNELRAFTDRIEVAADNAGIAKPDWETIFNYFDYRAFIDDKRLDDDGKKDVGLLAKAEEITVNRDWNGYKYIHFEIVSDLFQHAIEKGIKVKLFTGTGKINTLRAGYGDDISKHVNYIQVDRAEPKGQVIQYKKYSGSKYKITETLRGAKETLEADGIKWQDMPLLTLKAAVGTAREMGYKIPQRTTSEGELEDLYIENCSGIDALKGQDLIVVGKADLPKNAYVDMLHNPTLDTRMARTMKVIPDTGEATMIHGFINNELWQLQYEKIREMIEQAVGRARNLWYENTVYVFCDFPVRAATQVI